MMKPSQEGMVENSTHLIVEVEGPKKNRANSEWNATVHITTCYKKVLPEKREEITLQL